MTNDDGPMVHIEEAILFPTYERRISAVHVNPNQEIIAVPFVRTGCKQNVTQAQCSFNPNKVNCQTCREFAAMEHGKLARIFHTALGLSRKQDPILLRQLKAKEDHHRAHAEAFSKPLHSVT